jgi:hypothetical protein
MTVQLDWPPEVVARLREEARERGLTLDVYVLQTVLERKPEAEKDIIERGTLQPDEREKQVRELFEVLDSTSVPVGVSEETFHRENWYR